MTASTWTKMATCSPLGKELVDLFHAMGAGERPVFGHDPAGGGADKAGQQQQYHQGPQRILTGVVGVAPLIVSLR